MIKAELVAHSINPQGDELISILATFPRIILAEVNTHRMLSKNTASSRAIPFRKMIKTVLENPFIPMAFQKDHAGMQGTEYLDGKKKYSLPAAIDVFRNVFKYTEEELDSIYKDDSFVNDKVFDILVDYGYKLTLQDWWLTCRDKAVECAIIMASLGVTKQICNRLLEPFMWTTMLITSNRNDGGWNNFFELRTSDYVFHDEDNEYRFKSRKEVITKFGENEVVEYDTGNIKLKDLSELQWLGLNKGQAEIHMMDLAEKIYDAVNESTPKQLKEGEWHIPFGNKLNDSIIINHLVNDIDLGAKYTEQELKVCISTAMAARTSYTTIGEEKEINYEQLLSLHNKLINQKPLHASPMEHCARAMSDEEYDCYAKDVPRNYENPNYLVNRSNGWCRNYKGFIQYRHILETDKTI